MAKKKSVLKSLPQILKKHFLSGLFLIIPIAVIGWIFVSIFQTLWQLNEWIPDAMRPQTYIRNEELAALANFLLALFAAFVLSLLISLLGWASKNYFGKKVLESLESLIERIPVIRGIYSSLAQLLKTISSSGGSKQFSRVVYIEYPRKGLWTLAFVTRTSKLPGDDRTQSKAMINVYVPTTPNPTSGFFLVVPEDEVRESNMKVEEAFKTILSLGIA